MQLENGRIGFLLHSGGKACSWRETELGSLCTVVVRRAAGERQDWVLFAQWPGISVQVQSNL